jgi:hypothetical protein
MKKTVEKAFQQKVFIIVKQACVHTNIAGVKGHKSCNYLITLTETLSTSVMQPFQQETHSQTHTHSLSKILTLTLSLFLSFLSNAFALTQPLSHKNTGWKEFVLLFDNKKCLLNLLLQVSLKK